MVLERFEVGSPCWPIFKSLCRDLLRNLILGKINLCSFFPAQELTYIKNWLSTLEGLSAGDHLPKWHILCQIPWGFRTTIKFNSEHFFRLFDSVPESGSQISLNVTTNQRVTNLVIPTHICWVKSLMGIIFPPTCRPPSFLIRSTLRWEKLPPTQSGIRCRTKPRPTRPLLWVSVTEVSFMVLFLFQYLRDTLFT